MYGRSVLVLKENNLFLLGDGYTDNGQFPFLDQYNINTMDKKRIYELYDLDNDISEKFNVYDQHPDIVDKLLIQINRCIKDIGDESSNIQGENIRPPGKVDNPVTLTEYDVNHPYFTHMYDLSDTG